MSVFIAKMINDFECPNYNTSTHMKTILKAFGTTNIQIEPCEI